jgi:hypothetical protein
LSFHQISVLYIESTIFLRSTIDLSKTAIALEIVLIMTSDTKRPAEATAIPDYMLDPNAVLHDQNITWRYKQAPDYNKVNATFEETRTTNHEPGSLPSLVQNLVKNWEKEASYKINANEWRTIDPEKYIFHVNGGVGMNAEDMLRLGTYNALLDNKPVEGVYDPKVEGLQGSHKLFKRVMPVFSWEVLEVYSGPPVVAFKWRHWGQMTGKYTTKLESPPRQITAEPHNGPIDIVGVTIAHVSGSFKIEKLEVFHDPGAILTGGIL